MEPVTETECRQRTDRIIGKLDAIADKLSGIGTQVVEHRAWHSGQEFAAKTATEKAGLWSKWGAVIISLAVAVGGVVAYLTKFGG